MSTKDNYLRLGEVIAGTSAQSVPTVCDVSAPTSWGKTPATWQWKGQKFLQTHPYVWQPVTTQLASFEFTNLDAFTLATGDGNAVFFSGIVPVGFRPASIEKKTLQLGDAASQLACSCTLRENGNVELAFLIDANNALVQATGGTLPAGFNGLVQGATTLKFNFLYSLA